MTVYVLGIVPILLHLFAALLNAKLPKGSTPSSALAAISPAVTADAYLYAFIIALAASVDTLPADGTKNAAGTFLLFAGAAGFLNFVSLDNAIAAYPVVGPALRTFVWLFLAVVLLGYAAYRLPRFYGEAVEEQKETSSATGMS